MKIALFRGSHRFIRPELVKFFIKKAFSKFNNSPRNKKQNTDYIDMDPDN